MATSATLTAAFGLHCPASDDPRLKETISKEYVDLSVPSGSTVNFLPFLDWLPGPMPGRVRAKAYQKREDSFFTEVICEAVSGKAAGMNTYVDMHRYYM